VILPLLARLGPPLAAFLAMMSHASQEVSRAAAAETSALAFYATVVLLAVAALARPGAAEALLGSVLTAAAVWVLPHGPLREGTVAALLVALFAIAAARRLAAERGGGTLRLEVALPLALGAQALLRSVVLLPPQLGDLGWRTPVILLVLPAAAAVAMTLIARRLGTASALLAGGAAGLAGPGWNVKTTLALLAVAAAAALLPRRWLPPARLPAGRRPTLRALGAAVAALLVVAALLAAPPWLRAEPAAALLRVPALPRASAAPLPGDVTLGAANPVWEAALPPARFRARTVVLDSTLANSAPVPRGARVATVTLRDLDGSLHGFPVRAGIDTGEWAAGRPDVAARLRAGAPEPWLSWVVGDYMARRYRSRWTFPVAVAPTRVRIERDPALPPEMLLSLHHLELRP
jgi:hypothetical protein